MSSPDPARDRAVRELTAIALGPTQSLGRALEAMTAELEVQRAAAELQRQEATEPPEMMAAAVAEAYLSGALLALQSVSAAIFGGIAGADQL